MQVILWDIRGPFLARSETTHLTGRQHTYANCVTELRSACLDITALWGEQ